MIFTPRAVGIRFVRLYQMILAPWLPPACRFTPTCSDYAIEALEHYGLLRGTARACARLFRCHPLHRGGFDPLT